MLAHRLLPTPAHHDEVDHRDVLGIFAQPHPARMRADGLAEFGSQQQDGEHFVQATEPAGVRLYDIDGIAGEELFEHDAIVNVLTGRDAMGRTALATLPWPRMSSGLTGSSIHQGSNREAPATTRIASSTSQTWLASIIRRRSGPISSRTMAQRRRSSLEIAADFDS